MRCRGPPETLCTRTAPFVTQKTSVVLGTTDKAANHLGIVPTHCAPRRRTPSRNTIQSSTQPQRPVPSPSVLAPPLRRRPPGPAAGFPDRPSPIHSGSAADNLLMHGGVREAHLGRASSFRRQSSPALPSGTVLAAALSFQEPGMSGGPRVPHPLHPDKQFRTESPVGPFVVPGAFRSTPGTTRQRVGNGSRLPCREHRLAPASFLLRPHSLSAGFQAPGCRHPGTGYHPGARRDSRVSNARRTFGHVGRG